MAKEIVQYGVLVTSLLIYLVYTVRFAITFGKNQLFTGRVKIFHLVMIWLIPFCWIFLLGSLMKTTPGSFEIKDKSNPVSSTESGLGAWVDPSTGTDG